MVIDNTSDIYPSRYINAADLKGRRALVTIREVSFEMLKDRRGTDQRKPVLYFTKGTKGWVVNKTNLKILQTISKNYHDWIGRTIELSAVPTPMGEGIVCSVMAAGANGSTALTTPEPDDDEVPGTFDGDAVEDSDLPF